MTKPDIDDINLTDPSFWAERDVDAAFEQLRQHRPVSRHEFDANDQEALTKGFWAVTRYADVVRVSGDSKLFVNGYSTILADQTVEEAREEGWFLNMDAPEHFNLRRIVAKAFSPVAVQSMQSAAIRYAKTLIDQVTERGECDFAQEVAQPFPVAVICDYLGIPAEIRGELHRLTVVALGGDVPSLGGAPAIIAAFQELNRLCEIVARERRSNLRDDVLSSIITAEVNGRRLGDREVGHFLQLLVTAGMETTGTLGSQGMRAFLDFPAQIDIWRSGGEEIAKTGFEELARWVTPVRHMRRTATADCEIAGQSIKAGDKVVMWYGSANRDSTHFDRPNEFDIRRDPNPHLAFGGGGRHTCLGAHFARMELPHLFNQAFSRWRDIECSGPAQIIPSRFVNGLSSLPIRFKVAGR